jgi:large subunit ribosomal protein L10
MVTIEKELIKKKKKQVDEIVQRVSAASVAIVSDYRGLSVPEMTLFRSKINENGGRASVYKNTLLRFAFNALEIEYPEALLKGPSFLITTDGDAATVSKVIIKFIKESGKGVIKGGVLEKKHVEESVIKELSSLPTREELISQTVTLIKGPLTGFVFGLRFPISGLLNVLNAVQNKKQEV